MNNNDALSQPIAYTDCEELESMQGPDGDTYANLWTIPHGFGQDIALYSQEYVTTLQSALKLEQEQSAYYERHMWNFHGLAESESQRAEAAERKYRDEFAKRVIDEVVDADPRQIMGKGRIREISEGADVLVGEKVLLAKTALYYIEKNREAIEGFQRVGLLLVDQQEHNAELERLLQQPALADVMTERQRQINAEGWTSEHDDEHENNEMAFAAACYALYAGNPYPGQGYTPPEWPWDAEFWRPSTERRDLVKAGALILAEIERLDRESAKATGSVEPRSGVEK